MGSDPINFCGNKKVPDETIYVSSRTIELSQSRCHLDSQRGERAKLSEFSWFSASGSSDFRRFFSACALNWIQTYPWQLTYASRREILAIIIVLITPSAGHLHAGATAGLSPSPALWRFLCIRYIRFIGLKYYIQFCSSYCEHLLNTRQNSKARHDSFL